jgi:hypothetical protein
MIELVRSILYSSDSYESPHDVRSNEKQNDKVSDISEIIYEIITKQLRNHMVAVNLGEIGNEVEDTARASLSWFTPGKLSWWPDT